jgi:hypothetical protein
MHRLLVAASSAFSLVLLVGLSGCHRHRVYIVDSHPVPPSYVVVRTPEPAPPSTFDRRAATAALQQVDISVCKPAGVPAGLGHAKVTFVQAGNISRVVVDAPANLSPEALSCIGRELGTARAPAFQGRDVTLGVGWRVR